MDTMSTTASSSGPDPVRHLEELWQRGERVPVETYLQQRPDLASDTNTVVELVLAELRLRRQRGEAPAPEAFLRRFPQVASLLRERFASPPSAAPTADEATASLPPVRGARTPARGHSLTGRRVASYEVRDCLGEGGMGIVFRAWQTELQRPVALKIIRPERLGSPDAVRRFRREVLAVARVEHPNIVRVYDAGQDGDIYYFAMEYIDGPDLQRLVHDAGPLPPAEASEYIRQAAEGLQYIHERGLVHRDIKPSNLMVTRPTSASGRPTVKILDLGLARLQQLDDDDARFSTMTGAGSLLGTPDYMAPEQVTNPHGADVRADLYSLGCTFYFLLTAQPPFGGRSHLEKLDMHLHAEPPGVERVRPGVPSAINAIVRRLMAKRPEDRYATPGELAVALQRLAAPPPPAMRTRGAPTVPPPPPASASLPGPLVARYVEPERKEVRLKGHTDRVRSVAFAPDGRTAISAGWDRTVRLWDLEGRRQLHAFEGHTGEVHAVTFLPDGQRAVSAGADNTLRIWEVAGKRETARIWAHTDGVLCVAVSEDGGTLLSGGGDKMLRVWDVSGGRELCRLRGHRTDVRCVAFSPDGRLALSGGGDLMCPDGAVRVWDLERGQELRRLEGHRDAVAAVVFSPDGQQALTGGWDQTVRLWDVDSGKQLACLEGHDDLIWGVAFAPDGCHAVSGGRDQTLRLWDLQSGRELRRFEGHTGAVTGVAFAPDGRSAVSCSADGTLRLWPLGPGN